MKHIKNTISGYSKITAIQFLVKLFPIFIFSFSFYSLSFLAANGDSVMLVKNGNPVMTVLANAGILTLIPQELIISVTPDKIFRKSLEVSSKNLCMMKKNRS